MQTFFIVAILGLGFLITFQIAKASEYVAVIAGRRKSKKANQQDQWVFAAGFPDPWIDRGLLLQ